MGDFTDWVKVNMQMYSQDEIAIDSTKKDVFYITMQLKKNLRYRYMLYTEGREFVDQDAPQSLNHKGILTNYVEVLGDEGATTIEEILHQNFDDEEVKQEMGEEEVKVISEEILF